MMPSDSLFESTVQIRSLDEEEEEGSKEEKKWKTVFQEGMPAQHVRSLIQETGLVGEAENIRALYHVLGYDQEIDKLSSASKFDLTETCKAFVYEILPPVIMSPIACCLLERSFAAGINVAIHRSYLPNLHENKGHFFAWFVTTCLHWVITGAVLLRCLTPHSQMDICELWYSYSCMLAREAIVALKYGFLNAEDLEAMRHPYPSWSFAKASKSLILYSWRRPIISDLRKLCITAQHIADVDLGAVSLSIDLEESRTFLKNLHLCHNSDERNVTSTAYFERTGHICADDLLLQLVCTNFSEPMPNVYFRVLLAALVFICLSPVLVRMHYGIPTFGTTHTDKFIYSGMIVSSVIGSFSFVMFSITAAFDLRRRLAAMNMLGELIEYPGVKFSKLFPLVPVDDTAGPKNVYLDISLTDNCYGWFLTRRAIRKVGENFHVRSLAYIGAVMAWAVGASTAINVIVWTNMRHHVATLGVLFIGIFGIMISSMQALVTAKSLQDSVPMHRLILKRKLVRINQEICRLSKSWGGNNKKDTTTAFAKFAKIASSISKWRGKSDDNNYRRLTCLREVMDSVEENIRYEEEEVNPVRLYGITAGPELVSGIFGIYIGILALALQQAYTANFFLGYDESGWFSSSSPSLTGDS